MLTLQRLSFLLVFGCTLTACSSLNTVRSDESRTYAADLVSVINATVESIDEAGLNIESQQWLETNKRYQINSYAEEQLVTQREGSVQVATIDIIIEQLDIRTTKVDIEASEAESHVMSSSADRGRDYGRLIFARLDRKIPSAEGE